MMKRCVGILLLLLVVAPVWAQRGGNVIGAPVYYDTLGNVIGTAAPQDSDYHLPKHHFYNRIERDFNAFFLESEILIGMADAAIGGQFAWVPQRWGAYCSGKVGVSRNYFALGPVLRLSDCGNSVDWHLYSGLVVNHDWNYTPGTYGGYRLGGELGFRIAMPRRWGSFCWTSGSLAVGYAGGASYFTLGLSLSLTSVVALSIW